MLKKYITTAALLAAGTALSQAAVVAVFNFGGSSETRAAWMATGKGWTDVKRSDNGEVIPSTGSGITISSTGASLAATGSGGSFKVGSATGATAIPDTLKNLSSGVFGDSSYDDLWGGSINLYNKDSSAANITISGLSANTSYTIYMLSARANANTSDNQTSGSVTWETTTSGASWSVYTWDSSLFTASGSSTVQFDGSTSGQNASIAAVTFNTGEATSITITAPASTSQFTLNGMVISSVPEPSAFGLLAGLGALALVASRRRRK